MDGDNALTIVATSLRLSCLNQLIGARRFAVHQYRIVHSNRSIIPKLGTWLNEAHTRMDAQTQIMNKTFEKMTTKVLTKDEVATILTYAYPDRFTPHVESTDENAYLRERLQKTQSKNAVQKGRREAVEVLFRGEARGYDQVTMESTAWGLYNAVAELETYRRVKNQLSEEPQNILGGRRGATISRTFEALERVM
jgi:hypothetical protein